MRKESIIDGVVRIMENFAKVPEIITEKKMNIFTTRTTKIQLPHVKRQRLTSKGNP